MLSISKLVVLFFVALGIWHLLNVLKDHSAKGRGAAAPLRPDGARRASPPNGARIDAVDLVPCGRCGAYVSPTDAKPCDRADCPGRR
jgi:hypothetical protein